MTTATAPITTAFNCSCDDWKYSDSYGYACDHMKAKRTNRIAAPAAAPAAQPEAPEAAPLTIDIQPAPQGGYCVTAKLAAGDAHDFFITQAEAVAFATTFYGGTVVEQAKAKKAKALKSPEQAPGTTAASCAKYGARAHTCGCPDAANRGGSYIDSRTGDKCCKHMLAIRTGAVDALAVQSIETGKPIAQLIAESAVRVEPAAKPADPRQAVLAELRQLAKGSPYYAWKRKELERLNDLAAEALSFSDPQVRLLLACAYSSDPAIKLTAKIAADDLGTSLAAIVRRADAVRKVA